MQLIPSVYDRLLLWYWMLDPQAQVLEEYAHSPEGYIKLSEHKGKSHFKPALFPGLYIDLGQIWE